MQRDTSSAVILAKAATQCVTGAKRHFLPSPRVGEGQGEGMVALATKSGLGPTADLLFGIAQKVGKKASPCTPLLPPALATGGMRQRHTNASLSLRTVCSDDASTTARCSAPRRGLKGRLVGQQLFVESLIPYGQGPTKRCASTFVVFASYPHMRWALQLIVAYVRIRSKSLMSRLKYW